MSTVQRDMSLTGQPPTTINTQQKIATFIGLVGLAILFLAMFNLDFPNHGLWLTVSLVCIAVGTIWFAQAEYMNRHEGIKNDGVYFKSLSSTRLLGMGIGHHPYPFLCGPLLVSSILWGGQGWGEYRCRCPFRPPEQAAERQPGQPVVSLRHPVHLGNLGFRHQIYLEIPSQPLRDTPYDIGHVLSTELCLYHSRNIGAVEPAVLRPKKHLAVEL